MAPSLFLGPRETTPWGFLHPYPKAWTHPLGKGRPSCHKTKPMRTLILIVALALSGCSALEERPQGSVTFSELGKGQLYGNGAEGIPASPQAIGDPAHWKALLDQMDRVDPQTEGLRGAAIDFST